MTIQQNNPAGNFADLKRFCYIIVLILMATSCTMSRVAIDVLSPPESPVDGGLTSCGWVNRVDPGKGYVEYYINGSYINKTSNFNDQLGDLTLRRIEQFTNELGYFDVKPLGYQPVRPNGRFDGPMMRNTTIQALCGQYNVDYIIALEGFDTDIDVEQSVTYSPGVDRNFGIVNVPMFDGLQTVTMNMFFRIYDRNGRVVHTAEETSQVVYSTTGDYPAEMHRKMRSSDGLLNEAAEKIADLYVNQVSPHWIRKNRSIYGSGSAKMEEAYAYANAGNWDFASGIWYDLVKSDDKRIAKKACFNMIVASEVAEDYDLAMEWANTCISTYSLKKAEGYLQFLKQRKRETESISQMFPKIGNR